ncbi:MAG: hypothetical protein EOP06_04045 [Proteobacteria bacterium]|nr:MAG: hypothetical protein EOP06_04045 [Pseudomonadota bacterium]
MNKFKKDSSDKLTNNFRANMAILGIVSAVVLLGTVTGLLKLPGGYKLAFSDLGKFGPQNPLLVMLVFYSSYLMGSYWASPDLDVRFNMPGKHSFPFKWLNHKLTVIARSKVPLASALAGFVLVLTQPLHALLNTIWRAYWHPLAMMFTHRGAVHWPILGTNIKILYIYSSYYVMAFAMKAVLPSVSLSTGTGKIDIVMNFFMSLFPTSGRGTGFVEGYQSLYVYIQTTPLAMIALIAWMAADICHSAVDFWDSKKRGLAFVPGPGVAPRGMIHQILTALTSALWRNKNG